MEVRDGICGLHELCGRPVPIQHWLLYLLKLRCRFLLYCERRIVVQRVRRGDLFAIIWCHLVHIMRELCGRLILNSERRFGFVKLRILPCRSLLGTLCVYLWY